MYIKTLIKNGHTLRSLESSTFFQCSHLNENWNLISEKAFTVSSRTQVKVPASGSGTSDCVSMGLLKEAAPHNENPVSDTPSHPTAWVQYSVLQLVAASPVQ